MLTSGGTPHAIGAPTDRFTGGSANCLQLLTELIADHLGVDESEITPETSLADDLGADSLDVAEIAIAVEDRLGVTVDDAELDRVRTVGEAAQLLDAKLDKTVQQRS